MKKKILISSVILLAGVLSLQSRSFPVANNLPEGENFYIMPKGSNLCLGVENDKRYKEMVLLPCYKQSTKWTFKKVRNGMYNIKSTRGGYLGIRDIKKRGSRATHTTSGRDVKFLAVDATTYHIKMRVDGRVLDVSKGKIRKNGAHVIQWDYTGKQNQQWILKSVKTRRLFNYRTYRAPVNNDASSSTGASNSLRNIMHDDYRILRYFEKCTYSQFSTDDQGNFLENALNGQKLSKRIIKVQKVVNGASLNSDGSVRSKAYRTLTKVNLSGGNFVEKMVKNKIKKDVNRALRKEKRSTNLKYLEQLLDNLS